MGAGASLMNMTEWELCYSPDHRGFSVRVDPTEIVRPAYAPRRGTQEADNEYPDASRDRPVILHREYNWRQTDGTWRRWSVGFTDGREQVARAQRDGLLALEVRVFACAFWPPGARPDDRVRIPRDEARIHCANFDAAAGTWTELPVDERCDQPMPSDR
jgi:hypothetical protein